MKTKEDEGDLEEGMKELTEPLLENESRQSGWTRAGSTGTRVDETTNRNNLNGSGGTNGQGPLDGTNNGSNFNGSGGTNGQGPPNGTNNLSNVNGPEPLPPSPEDTDYEKTFRDLNNFHIQRIASIVTYYCNSVVILVGTLGFLYSATLRCSLIPWYVALAILNGLAAAAFGVMSVADIREVRNKVKESNEIYGKMQVGRDIHSLERRVIRGAMQLDLRHCLIKIGFFGAISVFFSVMVALHLSCSNCHS